MKPKWMRWTTFATLCSELAQRDRAAEDAAAPLLARLERMVLDVASPELREKFAAITRKDDE
jgi:hypothetical protein